MNQNAIYSRNYDKYKPVVGSFDYGRKEFTYEGKYLLLGKIKRIRKQPDT